MEVVRSLSILLQSLSEVGVTNMCLESEFEHYEDNQHGWIGVQFDKVENCWRVILPVVISLLGSEL